MASKKKTSGKKKTQKSIKKKEGFFKKLFKKSSKVPTMKKWGIISWTSAIVLTVILIIGVFFSEKEMEVYATIVGLAWGEVTAYNIAYAWKEKAQNKLKITYGFLEKLAKEYGIENLTPILQSIISD